MVAWLRVVIAALVVLGGLSAVRYDGARERDQAVLAARLDSLGLDVTTTTSTTAAPPPAPPTTVPPAPSTTAKTADPLVRIGGAPPAAPAPAPRPPAVALPAEGAAPYTGLGTWVDVYDWSRTYTNGNPQVGPNDVDRMVAEGVQTLYIQASKWDSPSDIVDPDLLQPILDRAVERGIRVIGWYLPTLTDPPSDLRRLLAVAGLRNVHGLGVDIESRDVQDVGERNRRLVELSAALRAALPGRTLSAIVLPPVVLEVVNQNYWPGFPYREIAPSYDIWMTMGYWTNRKASSGYRDAYRYTRENVDRLRANVGNPDLPVHPIGGLGAGTTAADVAGYKQAVVETRGLGGSLYDWRTTSAGVWGPMRGFRAS